MWSILIVSLAAGAVVPEQATTIDARTAVEARFQRIDRDGDGFITPNEAPRVGSRSATLTATASPASWMENYDSDRDARVSAAEFLARTLAQSGPSGFTSR
jgi:Ca2+-binding EF-hand superfamily protein